MNSHSLEWNPIRSNQISLKAYNSSNLIDYQKYWIKRKFDLKENLSKQDWHILPENPS